MSLVALSMDTQKMALKKKKLFNYSPRENDSNLFDVLIRKALPIARDEVLI